jgi:two-component system cell cycle sensor histidine kinase/response regulator CckA
VETVLVVDDEEAVRALAADLLAAAGYTVLETGDPSRALRLVKEQTVHLLLSDVVMPLMKGTELANRVQQASATTKVLLMSGYTVAEVAASGRPFIAKPFTPAQLRDKVRQVLDAPSAFARGGGASPFSRPPPPRP